jgi:hypothetical protein
MASKYIQKFPIPEGFPDILHDLSKEILRNQPADIIEFCAMYFQCLQEGKELDYPKKGQNIPCDFTTVVPKINKTDKTRSNRDLEAHSSAITSSQRLNENVNEDEIDDGQRDYYDSAKVTKTSGRNLPVIEEKKGTEDDFETRDFRNDIGSVLAKVI